jgi:CRP-like cAMP-binding protein
VRSETGIIGREGFVGSAIVLFAESAPFEVIVQVEGRALQIKKGDLQAALPKSPALLATLSKFIHVFGVQTAQTAIANTHYTVNQRLARWLIMCRDRVNSNDFTMTHEFLSVMLGVRRSGVTEALNELEGKSIVRATRGRISILNPAMLVEVAGGSYGVAEQEYKRLMQTA